MSERTTIRSREIGLINIADETNPTAVRGLAYTADFRAEEERGSGELRAAFTKTAHPDSFQREVASLDPEFRPSATLTQADLTVAGEHFIALTTTPDAYGQERQITKAVSYIKDQTPWTRFESSFWKFERMTVPQLKRMAAEYRIDLPYKARKAQIIELIIAGRPVMRPNIHPAWFHYGDTLVIPRATGDEFAQVTEKMLDAAKTGHLVVGGMGSTAFGSGVTLIDERDLSAAAREEILKDRIWYLDQMSALTPIKEKLRSRGYDWYFLGNPTLISVRDQPAAVRYWLNGCSGPGYKQPFGWYSLEELLAEDFVTHAKEKLSR